MIHIATMFKERGFQDAQRQNVDVSRLGADFSDALYMLQTVP